MKLKRVVIVIVMVPLVLILIVGADNLIRYRSMNAKVDGALSQIRPGMTVAEADAAYASLNIPHSRNKSQIVGMIRGRWGIEIVHRDVQVIASFDESGRVTEVHAKNALTGP